MKYDLSNIIYYHGEEECPYKGEQRFFWCQERMYVNQCEEDGSLSQEDFEADYAWKHINGVADYVERKFGIPSRNTVKYYLSGARDEEARQYIYQIGANRGFERAQKEREEEERRFIEEMRKFHDENPDIPRPSFLGDGG